MTSPIGRLEWKTWWSEEVVTQYQIHNFAVETVIVFVAGANSAPVDMSAVEVVVSVDMAVEEVVSAVEEVVSAVEAIVSAEVEAMTPVDLNEEVVLFPIFLNNDYNEYLI
jgi:hypothetical protein